MARLFSTGGGSEGLEYGSDASIDGFTLHTVLLFHRFATPLGAGTFVEPMAKAGFAATWALTIDRAFAGEGNAHLRYTYDFDGLNNGDWDTADDTVSVDTVNTQIGVKFNRNSNANDPVFYIDRAAVAAIELLPPLGNSVSDAAQSAGSENHDAANSAIGFLIYDNTLFTDAQVRRHYWWGCAPGGPSTVVVWHPLWSSELRNKGTGVADATEVGATSLTPLPKVERCSAGLMGVGR